MSGAGEGNCDNCAMYGALLWDACGICETCCMLTVSILLTMDSGIGTWIAIGANGGVGDCVGDFVGCMWSV